MNFKKKIKTCYSKTIGLIYHNITDLKSQDEILRIYFDVKPEILEKRSNSISLYQTCIMMMTITAISAVDFKMFPARFRKSKTFGISLVIRTKYEKLISDVLDGYWSIIDYNCEWICYDKISSWSLKIEFQATSQINGTTSHFRFNQGVFV